MAYSFLVFDFGNDEDAAQQARHRIDGWRQGYRLDKKMQVRFDRTGDENSAAKQTATPSDGESKPSQASGGKSGRAKATATKKASEPAETPEATGIKPEIKLIVRLDFSEHEKLSHHRWLERIPTEEPFKQANPVVFRPDHSDYASIEERFGALEGSDAQKYSK